MVEVTVDRWLERILEEHGELRAMLADLRRYLEAPRPEIGEEGQHTWCAGLSERLVRLHGRLFRHFRYEEGGGMVEELERRHPEETRAIEDLVGEHPEILGQVRCILGDTLAYSEGMAPAEPELRRRLNRLLERLEQHEHEETHLMQRVEYRDIGAGD